MHMIGSHKEPLTIEQFSNLYLKLTKDILSKEDSSRTAEALLNLEELNDSRVGELLDILNYGKA